MLDDEGVPSLVLDLTSADRLYREWRLGLRNATRAARSAAPVHQITRLIAPHERRLPVVTVHDASSHHLAWIGGVFGAPTLPVGVDAFGQSGSIADLYHLFDLTPEQIVNAALAAIA
jgi:pyruvate dehydrogenase E1 component